MIHDALAAWGWFFRKLQHRLAHWLGWNGGHVESYWFDSYVRSPFDGGADPARHLIVAFRCSCGRLSQKHCRGDFCQPRHRDSIDWMDYAP